MISFGLSFSESHWTEPRPWAWAWSFGSGTVVSLLPERPEWWLHRWFKTELSSHVIPRPFQRASLWHLVFQRFTQSPESRDCGIQLFLLVPCNVFGCHLLQEMWFQHLFVWEVAKDKDWLLLCWSWAYSDISAWYTSDWMQQRGAFDQVSWTHWKWFDSGQQRSILVNSGYGLLIPPNSYSSQVLHAYVTKKTRTWTVW